MKKIFFSLIISMLAYPTIQVSASKPRGLMTDLIEHTDYVWKNGHPTNLKVFQPEVSAESYQFAEIRSSYPTFSWIVSDEAPASFQQSYRIIVSDNIKDAEAGTGNIWDSGAVESRQSTAVLYGGDALKPASVYFWRVKTVTNTSGESEWSDIKAFKTADKLTDYAASYYPQVKTTEYPVAINKIANTYLIDFGKDAFSQLIITLSSENDDDSVTIHIGECLADGKISRRPGGTIRYYRYSLKMMKGIHTYRVINRKDMRNTGGAAIKMPDYTGEVAPFRYCEIEGYSKALTDKDIYRESVHYPFNEAASSFESSDKILNQVWDLCKYSMKATSFTGIYIDGDRERIPYEADALINQLSHYSVDREYSIARRSVEYLFYHPTWPTEWILQASILAWNDYMYTGDSRSLKANYDILKIRTLMQLKEKNGLISTTTGLQTPDFKASIRYRDNIRDIVDWPQQGGFGAVGESDGFVFTDYNAVTNAYHYNALRIMYLIAEVLGNQNDASYYRNEAAKMLAAFNKVFFNAKQGVYVDGDTTLHASLHANMFPIAFGMTPAAKLPKILDLMHSRRMACSVYGSQFLMDALYDAADADYALEMLTKTDDRSWYNMIKVGSTISLEAWDNKYKPNQDWNHAWGAAPANIIVRKLMGVEPLQPGFSKVRIRPQTASLEWAKAVIPTVKGDIHIATENKSGEYRLTLTIPANMECEVLLPLLSKKYEVTVNGKKQKATSLKDAPFVSLATISSGKYEISMKTL